MINGLKMKTKKNAKYVIMKPNIRVDFVGMRTFVLGNVPLFITHNNVKNTTLKNLVAKALLEVH